MNTLNGMCTLCTTPVTIHFIYCMWQNCSVWREVEQKLQDIVKYNVNISEDNIVFGFYEDENQEHRFIDYVIVLETKRHIWKNRCSVKLGKKKW